MILLGGTVSGRLIEQHDMFIGIGENLSDLKTAIGQSWKEAKVHIDAWREVNIVEEYQVKIVRRADADNHTKEKNLFFINLGGYMAKEFDEFHYKMLIVANDAGEAVRKAKQSLFYKNTGIKGAPSHIDDKYGIDVDDIYAVEDILLPASREQYTISITKQTSAMPEDEIHLGYLPLDKL